MYENFDVSLLSKINENNELEINENTRNSLLNQNFHGKLIPLRIYLK